jgi:hypothetical protein
MIYRGFYIENLSIHYFVSEVKDGPTLYTASSEAKAQDWIDKELKHRRATKK